MYAKSLVLLLAAASSTLAVTVNTPMSVIACQPIRLTWGDGTAPYFVAIIPGGNPSGTPLKQFPSSSTDSITWTVDQPAGTSITVSVTDSTGEVNYSDAVTIGSGPGECDVNAVAADATDNADGAAAAAPAAASPAAESSSAPARAARPAAAESSASSGASVRPVAAAAASGSSTPATREATTDEDSSASTVALGSFAGLVGLVGFALA